MQAGTDQTSPGEAAAPAGTGGCVLMASDLFTPNHLALLGSTPLPRSHHVSATARSSKLEPFE